MENEKTTICFMRHITLSESGKDEIISLNH